MATRVERLARRLEAALRLLVPLGANCGLDRSLALTQGMISREEAGLLYDLARAVSDGCIVEVGSYRGRSSVALSRGAAAGHNVPVYAIDPHEEFQGVFGAFGPEDRRGFYSAMIRTGSYMNVRLVNVSSEVIAVGWKMPVGLLWLDGDHTLAGVTRDYECWQAHLLQDAKIALDDSLDPSLGPFRLIERLLASGQCRLVERRGKVTVLQMSRVGPKNWAVPT